MIKNLLKVDIKKTSKILVYMYAFSIIFAVLARLINIGNHIQAINIIGLIFEGFAYSAIGNVLVNTFLHILRNFITSFYKDESYLTHTLPVTKNQLLISKYLSGIIVILESIFVCFASLFIMFYSPEFMQTLKAFIEITVSGFNMSVAIFITLITLIIFAQICSIISMSYAAIIKGNEYNSKRLLKGLLWFAVYYFGSMISTILVTAIIFAIGGNISELYAATLSQPAFTTILIIGLISYISYTLLFYFVSKKLFNKGVNVD